ncbi:hypothetical protein [uncultured Muribaculum sp.]|uniref:hypothetical protein n=1 Tax=uncultured Muribaculum sp. TaxID=1918613 RepID=UPI0025D9386B|nr:hypothetical protein [uncultured Muribaculum sp.]
MSNIQYLALGVLHRGKLYRNSIVSLVAGRVVIQPFDGEVAQTVFVSGLVAVCDSSRLTSGHRRALTLRVQDAPLLDRAVLRADRYLTSNSLYLGEASEASTPVLLLLPRK